MRTLLLLVLVSIFLPFSLVARTQEVFSGSCHAPFVVQQWFTVIEFNDAGLPVRAAGVCCDGSVWTQDLELTTGSTANAVVAQTHYVSQYVVAVSADKEVDFRIVDVRTGNFVSPTYHYQPSAVLEIDISTLPVGAYGVAVIQNNSMLNLLPFGKL